MKANDINNRPTVRVCVAGLYAVSLTSSGAMQLMSDATRSLLCFNKKGNLIVRVSSFGVINYVIVVYV